MDEKEQEIIWKKLEEQKKIGQGGITKEPTPLDAIKLKIGDLERQEDEIQKELDDYYAFLNDPSSISVIDPKHEKFKNWTERDLENLEEKLGNVIKEKEKLQKLYNNLSPSKTEIIDPDLN